MFTADQIVVHLVGDYILQSQWMADNKTKNHVAAAIHAFTYTAPFSFLTSNVLALVLIFVSHFVVDRWRLARFVVWVKNGAQGPITATGYPEKVPAWMATWLLIIADNTIHILGNGFILYLFP